MPLYALNDTALYTVDTTTPAATQVGSAVNFGLDAGIQMYAMAWNGSTLYAIGGPDSAQVIYAIDPATGVATKVTDIPNVRRTDGMAWDGTSMYLHASSTRRSQYELWTLNLLNGAITQIGDSGRLSPSNISGLMCMTAVGDKLYASHNTDRYLVEVNKTTGARTRVGRANFFGQQSDIFPRGMAYDGTTVWLLDHTGNLFTMNLTNGVATRVGEASDLIFRDGDGLEWFVSGPPAPRFSFSVTAGENQSLKQGEVSASITVKYINANTDEPVANADVKFAVSGAGATVSSATGTTDAAGNASVTVTMGTADATLTITIGDLTDTVDITYVPPPPRTHILINSGGSGQTGQVEAALSTLFSVRVTDLRNINAGGRTVTFTLQGSDGSLSATEVVTNRTTGRASTRLTFGARAGVYTVTATTPGAREVITFTATALPNWSFSIGTGDKRSLKEGETTPISIKLIDTVTKAGVANVDVAFSISGAGASLSSLTATTDSAGNASVTATMGTANATVSIRIGSLAVQTFTVTYVPPVDPVDPPVDPPEVPILPPVIIPGRQPQIAGLYRFRERFDIVERDIDNNLTVKHVNIEMIRQTALDVELIPVGNLNFPLLDGTLTIIPIYPISDIALGDIIFLHSGAADVEPTDLPPEDQRYAVRAINTAGDNRRQTLVCEQF